jgi:chitodextrinase
MILYIISAMAMVLVVTAGLLSEEATAQTDPPTDGNWIVNDVTLVRDTHVFLNGNLTIGSQGHLTLENVSLELNNTRPGRYNIFVGSGGWMVVTDKDDDPTTRGDASLIYPRNPNAPFGWHCSPDSVLRISSSTVRGCSNIDIETHDAMISNSTIEDGIYGVYADGGTVILADTTFDGFEESGIFVEGGSAQIDRCVVTNCTYYGIAVTEFSYATVRNTTVRDTEFFGLTMSWSNFTIEDCLLFDNVRSGLTIRLSRGRVARSTISTSTMWGIDVTKDCNVTIEDCEVFNIDEMGIRVQEATVEILGSHVHDCQQQGVQVKDADIKVIDCTFERNGQGMVISDSQLFIVEDCTIRWNDDTGLVLGTIDDATMAGWVLGCLIYENDLTGIYVTNDATCILWDSHIRDNGLYGIYCRFGGRVEWEVTGSASVVNETLELMGTVDIDPDGDLSLVNTTLEFNEDRFGDIGYLSVGGFMTVRDDDPDAVGDESEITVDASWSSVDEPLEVIVHTDGNLAVTRSIFSRITIRVEGGTLVANDCQFEKSGTAVIGKGYGAFIGMTECTITDCTEGVSTTDEAVVALEGCSFFRMGTAISVNTSDGSSVKNTTVFSSAVGIDLWRTWALIVDNCTLTFCNDGIITNKSSNLEIIDSTIDRSNGHGIRGWDSLIYLYDSVVSRCSAGGVVVDNTTLWVHGSDMSANTRVGIRGNDTWLIMTNTSVTGTDGIGVWNSFTPTGIPPLWNYLMRDCFLQGSTAYDLRLEGRFLALVYDTQIEPEDTRVFDGVVLEVYNGGNLQVIVRGVQPMPPAPIDYVLVDQYGSVTGVGTFAHGTNERYVYGKSWTMTINETTNHSPYTATVTVAGREWSGDLELGFNATSVIWVEMDLLPYIAFPDEMVEGADVALDASGSSGYPFNITGWTWATEDGETLQGPRVTLIFGSDGDHSVKLTITDEVGNSNTTTHWFTVEDASPEAIIITDVPDEIDEDQSLELEGRFVTLVDEIIIQEWDFGDGNKANGASATHQWTHAGEYNITYTVVEADGSLASEVRTIKVVNVAPIAIIKQVEMEVGKRERFDLDGSPSLDTPSDNGTLRYMWDMGGDPFLTGAQAFWRFEEMGVYEINLLVVDDDGAWDKTAMTVTVINRPPTIGPIPDARLNATDPLWSYRLVISDPDDDLLNLTLSYPQFEPGGAFSSWVERDDDGGWTVYVRPKEEPDGWRADVEVTVMDPDGGSASTTFHIEIDVSDVGSDTNAMWWAIIVMLLVLVVLTIGYMMLVRKRVVPPPGDKTSTEADDGTEADTGEDSESEDSDNDESVDDDEGS